MNGVIIVNKEAGFTSHDVVAKLRGILKERRIGHTGTLDPDATGVLPICVGKATKVCDVLTDRDKTYEAWVVLGITTDTLDTSGTVLSRHDVDIDEDRLKSVLSHYIGEITQIPPMYSAVKVNGKKLYEYAREGKEVERKERRVTIYELELTESNLSSDCPGFKIRVKCSKGTYIRTLCDDIGRELGCGAAMKSLVRTAVGRFTLEQAHTLDEIAEFISERREYLDRESKINWLIPIDSIFEKYKQINISDENMRRLVNGNELYLKVESIKDKEIVRIYGSDGIFYALYQWDEKRGRFSVFKYFG